MEFLSNIFVILLLEKQKAIELTDYFVFTMYPIQWNFNIMSYNNSKLISLNFKDVEKCRKFEYLSKRRENK